MGDIEREQDCERRAMSRRERGGRMLKGRGMVREGGDDIEGKGGDVEGKGRGMLKGRRGRC